MSLNGNFTLFSFTVIVLVLSQMFMTGGIDNITFVPQPQETYSVYKYDVNDNIEIWIVDLPLTEQLQWFVIYKSDEYILLDYSYEEQKDYTIMKVKKKAQENNEFGSDGQ